MLSANVLQLTVITTTLSFNVLTWVLMVANAKLSVYVLSLTVATATLKCKHVDTNGCNCNAKC